MGPRRLDIPLVPTEDIPKPSPLRGRVGWGVLRSGRGDPTPHPTLPRKGEGKIWIAEGKTHGPETEATSSRDPLDALAEEFAERCRRGEAPSVEEYAARHPELAEEIRRLLPTVAFLEAGRRKAAGPGSGSGEIADAGGPAVRAARREPGRPRDRPRRDGGRLRGDPGAARPPGRREGPAGHAPRPTARAASGSSARRRRSRGSRTRTSSRSTPWASRTACPTTSCR